MILVDDFINSFSLSFPTLRGLLPWQITGELPALLLEMINALDKNYTVENGVAIHYTTNVEQGSVLKGPAIISSHCFIG
ncbi:MAG: hypothetical protein ABIN67_14255, partial [Ferruginibacter sp.]